MKKRTLFTTLILVFTIGLNLLYAQQDEKAKGILDKLSKKTAEYKSMKADFEYQMLNESEAIDETQKGSLTTKGEKYHLMIAGQEIISDGTTVWTVLAEAEEVQVNTVPEESEAEEFISPTSILTLWEKGFKYKYDKSDMLNNVAVDIINLYPEKAEEKSFHTIQLFVDRSKSTIVQIIIKGKDGTDFIYKIKSFQTDVPVQESTFSFSTQAHPDFEVIDLR
jgi:outer membrane lipoprotein-sorting protein